MAVGIYFALQPYVGTEEIGWMCILGAAPFAACGFFTYHGMTAEQVLWAWFKSEILCQKRLVFKSDSYYYEAMQPAIRVHLADLKDKAETLPRKANEDAGLMARGILVNLGEMDIKNLHGPESYKAGLKLNHGRRPMVPLPN